MDKAGDRGDPPRDVRTIESKIDRLRTRLKAAPIDANVKALLLGILDLLGDEL